MSAAEELPIEEGVAAEVLDEEPRSILLGLISQLTKGMDLHRVTLPTFVLEPRSMLERVTDFMSHPDILFQYLPLIIGWIYTCISISSAAAQKDDVARFVETLKFYLSGWHIRPKVPILITY